MEGNSDSGFLHFQGAPINALALHCADPSQLSIPLRTLPTGSIIVIVHSEMKPTFSPNQ